MTVNCRNCGEPIRPTEERDQIGRARPGPYEFDWVHDNGPNIGGNPYCDLEPIAEPS